MEAPATSRKGSLCPHSEHLCVVRPGSWATFHTASCVAESFCSSFRQLVGVSSKTQCLSSLLLPNKLQLQLPNKLSGLSNTHLSS